MELEVGEKNLKSFINQGFEHIHLTPNTKAMKKINRLGFIKKGSPYYGWLVSILTGVIRIALHANCDRIYCAVLFA